MTARYFQNFRFDFISPTWTFFIIIVVIILDQSHMSGSGSACAYNKYSTSVSALICFFFQIIAMCVNVSMCLAPLKEILLPSLPAHVLLAY